MSARDAEAVLARESTQAPIAVPRALLDLEPDLQRLSARIRACEVKDPFQEEALKGTPKVVLRGVLHEAGARGLLEPGPGWVQRLDQVPDTAEAIRGVLARQVELDRGIAGGQGRGI